MNIIRFVKDIIAPKKCYFCSAEGHFFCPKCHHNTKKIPPICYVCKEKSPIFSIHNHCRQYLDSNTLMVLFPYQKLKKLIKDSKYYTKKDILEDLWKYSGEFLVDNLKIENKQNYIILPIPMNFWRKSRRWYNHADVLAKYLSKASGISYNTKIIKRVKNTLQQSKLTKTERLSNLDGAFSLDQKYKEKLKGKKVILIDDVVSTGVTFLEVIAVLKNSGIESIDCFAVASDTPFFDEKV